MHNGGCFGVRRLLLKPAGSTQTRAGGAAAAATCSLARTTIPPWGVRRTREGRVSLEELAPGSGRSLKTLGGLALFRRRRLGRADGRTDVPRPPPPPRPADYRPIVGRDLPATGPEKANVPKRAGEALSQSRESQPSGAPPPPPERRGRGTGPSGRAGEGKGAP